jgi:hypothetical protein
MLRAANSINQCARDILAHGARMMSKIAGAVEHGIEFDSRYPKVLEDIEAARRARRQAPPRLF